jgi:hypothetical protein
MINQKINAVSESIFARLILYDYLFNAAMLPGFRI